MCSRKIIHAHERDLAEPGRTDGRKPPYGTESGALRLKFYPKTIRGAKKSEVVDASCGVPRFVLTFSTLYSFL